MRTAAIMCVVLLTLAILPGCAGREVRCDGPLEPINLPQTTSLPAAAARPRTAPEAPAP